MTCSAVVEEDDEDEDEEEELDSLQVAVSVTTGEAIVASAEGTRHPKRHDCGTASSRILSSVVHALAKVLRS